MTGVQTCALPIYCGIPAGLDAFKAAHEVLLAEGALAAPKPEKPKKKKSKK